MYFCAAIRNFEKNIACCVKTCMAYQDHAHVASLPIRTMKQHFRCKPSFGCHGAAWYTAKWGWLCTPPPTSVQPTHRAGQRQCCGDVSALKPAHPCQGMRADGSGTHRVMHFLRCSAMHR